MSAPHLKLHLRLAVVGGFALSSPRSVKRANLALAAAGCFASPAV